MAIVAAGAHAGLVLGLVFLGSIVVIYGKPQFGPSGGPPPMPPGGFPPIPPEVRQVLPPDAVTKLEAIHSDNSLDFMQKQRKIDQVMSSLPAEVLDKIPPPPGFYNLPADVQQQLKDIQRSRTLTFEQKQQQTQQLIQSLPENLRRMLGPMGGPPPPRMARMLP